MTAVPSIDLTPRQAQALADLSSSLGSIALHQVVPDHDGHLTGDVYVTPHGWDTGYRVDVDGRVAVIGATLPAPD